jgi:hypothetical protein
MPLCTSKRFWAALAGAVLLVAGRSSGDSSPAGNPVAGGTNAVLKVAERERALVEAWSQSADPKAMPVENMTLPIAHHANGRVRALLRAGRALIPPTDAGYIRAQEVVVEIYNDIGVLEGILVAENCFFDRATSAGYSEGNVRIKQRGVRIRGKNMVWNLDANSAKILSQPEVRFDRFMKGIGDLFK